MRNSLRASILPGVGAVVSIANIIGLLRWFMYGITPYMSMIIMGMISIGRTGKIKFTTMINMMMIASSIQRTSE